MEGAGSYQRKGEGFAFYNGVAFLQKLRGRSDRSRWNKTVRKSCTMSTLNPMAAVPTASLGLTGCLPPETAPTSGCLDSAGDLADFWLSSQPPQNFQFAIC